MRQCPLGSSTQVHPSFEQLSNFLSGTVWGRHWIAGVLAGCKTLDNWLKFKNICTYQTHCIAPSMFTLICQPHTVIQLHRKVNGTHCVKRINGSKRTNSHTPAWKSRSGKNEKLATVTVSSYLHESSLQTLILRFDVMVTASHSAASLSMESAKKEQKVSVLAIGREDPASCALETSELTSRRNRPLLVNCRQRHRFGEHWTLQLLGASNRSSTSNNAYFQPHSTNGND